MALTNLAPEAVEENIKRIDEFSEMKCHNNYPVGWAMAGVLDILPQLHGRTRAKQSE